MPIFSLYLQMNISSKYRLSTCLTTIIIGVSPEKKKKTCWLISNEYIYVKNLHLKNTIENTCPGILSLCLSCGIMDGHGAGNPLLILTLHRFSVSLRSHILDIIV